MNQTLDSGIQLLPQCFNCSFNNRLQLICVNSLCENPAFVCQNSNCICIQTYHKKCTFVSAKAFLHKLFARKKPLPFDSSSRKAIQQLRLCIQEVFDILSQIRETLDVFQANFGWDQIQSRLVELLNGNQTQQICGKMISCIHMKVKAKQQVNPFKRQEKYYGSQWNYEYIKKFEIQSQVQFMKKWQSKHKKRFMEFVNQELGWFTKYTNKTQQLIKAHPYQGKNGLEKQLIKMAKTRGWSEYSMLFRKGRSMQSIRHIQLSGQINGNPPRIQKCLQSLVNLKSLDLSRNKIFKIENLKFPYLSELNLSFNQIQRIENLEKVPSLESIRLDRNKIKVIQNLEKLQLLYSLQLQSNNIEVLENLQKLQSLKLVLLSTNPVITKKENGLKTRKSCLQNLVKKNVKIIMTAGGTRYGQMNFNNPIFIEDPIQYLSEQ